MTSTRLIFCKFTKMFLLKEFLNLNYGQLAKSSNILSKLKNKFLGTVFSDKKIGWLNSFMASDNFKIESREFLIFDSEIENAGGVKNLDYSVKAELEEIPQYILRQKWGINLLELNNVNPKPDNMNIPMKNELTDAENISNHPLASEEISLQLEESPLKIIPTQDILSADTSQKKENKQRVEERDELSAWQEVFTRTVQHIRDITETVSKMSKEKNEPKVKFSILPEPPDPKADVAILRSADDLKRLTALRNILESENFIYQHAPQTRILVHEFVGDPIKEANSRAIKLEEKGSKSEGGNGSL
ncbi:uncharacterized protein LOC130668054 isoform X2 [Microplitis mediator]|uniref:uncharacterized protein LOC130668054 isoform X2 n=1 Tax=Microplitis mediator TaxID=375433 RepID=UPI002552D7EE|nr:uncharacterized protein LOC130668054 isoform X2 [Microplitis mediator]